MELNQITVRDVNLSLSTNEFSKEFTSYAIFFLMDFFLGFDQIKLNKKSRDFMIFMTLLGFMWMNILHYGTTNSVAQFV